MFLEDAANGTMLSEKEVHITAYDLEELNDLWIDFCNENQFSVDSVTYVESI